MRRPSVRGMLPWLISLLSLAAPVQGHDLGATEVLAILKSDGTYQVDVTCHLDALALGAGQDAEGTALATTLAALPPEELAARIEAAHITLLRRVRVLFDGEAAQPQLTFPNYETPCAADTPSPESPPAAGLLGHTARFTGTIPPDASSFAFRASRAFPPVRLTILDQVSLSGERQVLEPGAGSAPFALRTAAP